MQKIFKISILLCFTYALSLAKSDHVIIDKQQHIYWQDNLSSKKSSEDFKDAVAYCDNLILDGLTQWRLPTFQELFAIADYTHYKPTIDSRFKYTNNGTYWTSTPFFANKSRAWTINFRNGISYYSYKSTNHAVRCVKDIVPSTQKESK